MKRAGARKVQNLNGLSKTALLSSLGAEEAFPPHPVSVAMQSLKQQCSNREKRREKGIGGPALNVGIQRQGLILACARTHTHQSSSLAGAEGKCQSSFPLASAQDSKR